MLCYDPSKKRSFVKQMFVEVTGRIKSYTLWSLLPYIVDWAGFRVAILRQFDSSRYFVYKLRSGVSFIVRPFKRDRCVVDEMFLYLAYFPSDEFDINNGDVVVDIGAHIGTFTIYAAKRAQCRVYSYEPRPDNFRLLNENIRLNRVKNRVNTFQYAVGGTAGNFQFSMDSDGLGQISGTEGRRIVVHTVTLKEIFDSNNLLKVDFLKVDIEGEESTMLLNLPTSFLSRINKIAMECHSPKITLELTSYLCHNGFDVTTSKLSPDHNLSMLYAKNVISIPC